MKLSPTGKVILTPAGKGACNCCGCQCTHGDPCSIKFDLSDLDFSTCDHNEFEHDYYPIECPNGETTSMTGCMIYVGGTYCEYFQNPRVCIKLIDYELYIQDPGLQFFTLGPDDDHPEPWCEWFFNFRVSTGDPGNPAGGGPFIFINFKKEGANPFGTYVFDSLSSVASGWAYPNWPTCVTGTVTISNGTGVCSCLSSSSSSSSSTSSSSGTSSSSTSSSSSSGGGGSSSSSGTSSSSSSSSSGNPFHCWYTVVFNCDGTMQVISHQCSPFDESKPWTWNPDAGRYYTVIEGGECVNAGDCDGSDLVMPDPPDDQSHCPCPDWWQAIFGSEEVCDTTSCGWSISCKAVMHFHWDFTGNANFATNFPDIPPTGTVAMPVTGYSGGQFSFGTTMTFGGHTWTIGGVLDTGSCCFSFAGNNGAGINFFSDDSIYSMCSLSSGTGGGPTLTVSGGFCDVIDDGSAIVHFDCTMSVDNGGLC